jgi:D-sedoheptulose 7-phosphate isomerase
MKIREFVANYLTKLKESLDSLPIDQIEGVARILWQAYGNDRQVFIMGNGGSAATATHFVCDLAKGTAVPGKKRFRVVGLNDNMSLVTAWANDDGYENVFKEQLENLVQKGDVVVAISGSGNSPNVLKVVEYANACGAITVGLTGFKGGRLKALAQECIVVPSDNMERIEDTHLILGHLIRLYLKQEIEGQGGLSG